MLPPRFLFWVVLVCRFHLNWTYCWHFVGAPADSDQLAPAGHSGDAAVELPTNNATFFKLLYFQFQNKNGAETN